MAAPPTSRSARPRWLRRQQTDAEHKLWMRLRGRQVAGAKFRRQEPIGPFVADFCCLEPKLIVELDGSQHASRSESDRQRTAFLSRLGYRVLRFWDHEVLGDVGAVLACIEDIIRSRHPLPVGEGRKKDPPSQSLEQEGTEASHLPDGEGTRARSAAVSGERFLTIHSHSEDETRAFGVRLARWLRGGELIGLVGELGSGKTCFVRGLAEGLGIAPQKVRSPTFTLVNEYSGGRLPLYHVDLYRLAPSPEDRMALRDYLYGSGVCVVEWFERLGEASPHLWIQFTFVGADERALVAQGRGAQYDALVDRLREG